MAAVRVAAGDDFLEVMRVVDAALLDVDASTVERRIERESVLVAGRERVHGALVAAPRDSGAHVEAVAVRRSRRGQGVGSALVTAALDRWGRLTAAFDPDVRPFYESLSFAVECRDGRCWGVR